jgi:glycosyltransferase involved in cell wall biosynthesis
VTSRLHIAHTESSLGWGGQEIRILSEARGMLARGHQVTLLAPRESRIYLESATYGIQAVALPIAWKRPRGVLALRRWLRANPPDVVNTHSSTDSWLTALSGWRAAVRTRHISAPVGANPASRWLYGSACRRVVTTGETLRRHLIEKLKLPESHVISVPTGIDLERFDRSKIPKGKKAAPLPDGALVFGIVATLRSWKGHAFLLEAFEQVAGARDDAQLLIVGDGPQRPALEAHIAAMRSRGRIHLTGQRDDVPELLAAMDCFVLPSYANEGVPQAVMQAMAMALPVVSTRVGAIEEAVVDGETGIFVPPRDPAALARAMLELAQSPEKRTQMGNAGRRVAERKFSLERMLDAMETVFSEAR